MIANLVQRIEEDFPTQPLEQLDPETLSTFSYAQSLVSHIPPETILPLSSSLSTFLSSRSGTKPLVITGESGIGKSTLLANYLLSLYKSQPAPPTEEVSSPKSSSPPKYSSSAKNPILSSTPPSSSSPLSSTPPSSSSPSKYGSSYKRNISLSSSPTSSPYKSYLSSSARKLAASANALDIPSNNTAHGDIKKETKKKEEVIVIPHFIGSYPTSANRYEILRKIILTLQQKLSIHFFLVLVLFFFL